MSRSEHLQSLIVTDLQERTSVATSPQARRGAHRAARPRLVALLPLLVVVAVVGVAALAAVFFTGLGGAGEPSAPAAAPTQEASALPEISAPPAASPSGGDEADGPPEPGATASESAPSPAPDEDAAGAQGGADSTTPVVVLNSTQTSGLAASAAEDLEGAGWAIAETGDQPGGAVPVTLVRYRDAEQEATARAVAQALGGSPTVERLASAKPGVVTVITGRDRTG